ncbi:MAG: biotin/lipoyl-containing protein [Pricia sp.]
MSNYSVRVSEEEFQLVKSDVSVLDVHRINASELHVLKNNMAYDVRLLKANFAGRTITLSVNGNVYDVEIKDEDDLMVQKMGLLTNASQRLQDIKAPMPGLIIDILVEPGQSIEEGTPLFILSAMKMENQILSQGSGTVKALAVAVGDPVEKAQLVIQME